MFSRIKRFLFLLILLNSAPAFSNIITNHLLKLSLMYSATLMSTINHEMGHAAIDKLRGLDPKIIIGDYNKYRNGIPNRFITFDSMNPNIGVTTAEEDEHDKKKSWTYILTIAMGGVCGAATQISQLYLLKKFGHKLPTGMADSLSTFITVRSILDFVYAFLPYFNGFNGDGMKLFHAIFLKTQKVTNFFSIFNTFNTEGKLTSFIQSYVGIYIVYSIAYYFLKYLNKAELTNSMSKIYDNKLVKLMNNLLIKESIVVEGTTVMIEQATDKSNIDDAKKYLPSWLIQLLIESMVF